MSIYHIHHIIPKHLGGTNDPSNLVSVTIEEHSTLHKQLWEDLGHWEDKIAWLGLSGRLGKEEIIREKSRLANIGNKNNSTGKGFAGWQKGKKASEETKKLLSASHLGNTSRRGTGGKPFHTEEHKEKMGEFMKGRKFITNGTINRFTKEPPPEGWWYGRTKL